MAPQRVPAEPLRRIDWLAVAPWLLLFRVPAIAASWRVWLPGAILGLVFQGWHPAHVERSFAGVVSAASEGIALPFTLASSIFGGMVRPDGVSIGSVYASLFIAVFFSLLALTIAFSMVSELVGGRGGRRSRPSFRLAIQRVLRVPMAWSLVSLPGLVATALACGLWWTGVAVAGPLVLVLSLIAAVALLTASVAAPLILAAVAIDNADIFDAVSRAVAYATQRVARLAFYVLTAASLGFAAGLFLEFVLVTQESIFILATGRSNVPVAPSLRFVLQLLPAALRGYYVAYWVVAAMAIYLLLRRDIDGQPLDEMAWPNGQPSAEA